MDDFWGQPYFRKADLMLDVGSVTLEALITASERLVGVPESQEDKQLSNASGMGFWFVYFGVQLSGLYPYIELW